MADREQADKPQVAEDINFQGRAWFWQRVGWAIMALLLLAGMLGVFGSGVLEKARAGDENSSLWLEYNRFGRAKAETSMLRVRLGAGMGREGRARVWLSRNYLEGMQIMGMVPQPESVETGPDRVTYVFRLTDPNKPTAVTFHLEPEKPGALKGQVGVEGGPQLDFTQYIYP